MNLPVRTHHYFLLIMLWLAVAFLHADRIVLKVFELPDAKKTDAATRADMAVIKAFEQKYPDIELRAFSGLKIEDMDLDAGPLLAIAGGVAPDIIYVNFRQSDTYIQNNFLYPMDEFLQSCLPQDIDYRVEKPLWPIIKRAKMGESNEHVWALPYETLVRVLQYRKDLFIKAGLNPNNPPQNWNELLEYSRRLTDPDRGSYGIFLAGGPQAAYDWITYLWSAGGDAVVQDATGGWQAAFASPAGVAAMEFYLKLLNTPWRDAHGNKQTGFAYRGGNFGQMYAEGKIGMRMDYLTTRSTDFMFDPNLNGLAPAPCGPTGVRGAELNARMMGIFSGAGLTNNAGLGQRDAAKVREAAFKYIWFFDSEEARQIRLKVMIAAGYGKMQNPVYLKRYGYGEYLRYAPPGWVETFEEALKNGRPEPYGRNCQKVYEYMTMPMEQIISLDAEGKLGDTPEERRSKIAAVLAAGQETTNKMMIGNLAPKERASRNRLATLVGMFILMAFVLSIYMSVRAFAQKVTPQAFRQPKHAWWAWMMLLPAVLTVVVWKYLPLLTGSLMAFQDYSLVGHSPWIGMNNFADVLYDKFWWQALGKTLYYMVLSLGLGFIPPIILAIMLQEVPRGKMFYRVIYYLPAVISGVIVIYLWKFLFDPTDAGGLNQILHSLGLPKSMWLKDEKLAMFCVVLPTIWAGVGPGSLIYLAALKGIPDEVYEAADLDGAGFLSKVRHIVLPYLKPLMIIQFIAAFIAAAQQSDFILVMTFGGPNNATKVADLLIFEKAYLYLKFGVASAMAWMLGVLLMLCTVAFIRRISRMEFKTYEGK